MLALMRSVIYSTLWLDYVLYALRGPFFLLNNARLHFFAFRFRSSAGNGLIGCGA